MIEARGGTLELVRPTAGSGAATIAACATLLADLGLRTSALMFAGSGGTLTLEQPDAFTSTVAGFGAGDTIELAGVATSSFRFDHGALRLLDKNQVVVDVIRFAGSYTGADFALAGDGHGGTTITFAAPHLDAFASARFAAADLAYAVTVAAGHAPTPDAGFGGTPYHPAEAVMVGPPPPDRPTH